jgi:cell wall assembly regulator SMI1
VFLATERLLEVMYKIKRDRADQCYLLVPDSIPTDFTAVEKALGISLPISVTAVINSWSERGIEALLTKLPYLLNPSATSKDLDPTGKSMREMFPTFCAMLDNTESFGIILDPAKYRENDGELLFIGVGERLICSADRRVPDYWAGYAPNTLLDIHRWEMTSGIQLSTQMRQLFLRLDGSVHGHLPYFLPLRWMQKGLLSDLYQDFWDQMESQENFERLEHFVSIFEGASGDDQGFFFDSQKADGEYAIYEWDHEAVKFTVVASDFASWLEQILFRGW